VVEAVDEDDLRLAGVVARGEDRAAGGVGAVRIAPLVASPPFLQKNAQSALFTVSVSSSAYSIILWVGVVRQSPMLICLVAAALTSWSQ